MIKTEESVRPIVAKRLTDLMELNHITNKALSEAIGIGESTINMLRNGRYPMHADILCKIADYFAVPTDYILGRCELGETYKADMTNLYEECYEKYLRKQKGRAKEVIDNTYSIESMYPYNLLEALYGVKDPFSLVEYFPITGEQMEGLKAALTKISEREQRFLKRYFEEYATLDEIAAEEGIGRERVRQILQRGLRKLRHPSRFNLIRYGVNAAEMNIHMKELAKKVAEIKEMEEFAKEHEYLYKLDSIPKGAPKEFVLDDLNLSVRSYNCIRRSTYRTEYKSCQCGDIPVSYIESLFIDDKILKVRNLGQKSLLEIANKLKEFGSTSEWVLKWCE